MTIRSHPSEASLCAYAAGTLPSGQMLAVASHLEFCRLCRQPIAAWEDTGGALLTGLAETALANDALTRTLARAQAETSNNAETTAVAGAPLPGIDLPRALRRVTIERRHWVAPGIWRANIATDARTMSQTYLLRLGPKQRIPHHGHQGTEMICVLKGSFADASGRYEAGDLLEMDEAVEHEPVATPDGECICIIASDAPPQFRGPFGWLLRLIAR